MKLKKKNKKISLTHIIVIIEELSRCLIRKQNTILLCILIEAYFCHHWSDSYMYVDLSDFYVVLSDLYVDLLDIMSTC